MNLKNQIKRIEYNTTQVRMVYRNIETITQQIINYLNRYNYTAKLLKLIS
jgi:hypothetical protein